jgi:hypothetical protein
MIMAVLHVSESELQMVIPEYSKQWADSNPAELKDALWKLGLDTNFQYTFQTATQHRNRLSQVVLAGRYYGDERSDPEWLKSGYASQAAIDKARGSKFTDDLYRQKGLTVDTQIAMEIKDKYNTVEEEY